MDTMIFEEKPIFVPDILETNEGGENYAENSEVDSSNQAISESLRDTDSKPPDIGEVRLEPWTGINILKDWNQENWDDLMIRMYDAPRTHKWCIVCLYDEPPYWQIFTYREIEEIVYDKNDIPIKAHAIWSKQLPLSHSYNQHDIWINLTEKDAEL